jgi:uncharacterized membrane protein
MCYGQKMGGLVGLLIAGLVINLVWGLISARHLRSKKQVALLAQRTGYSEERIRELLPLIGQPFPWQ